jgi:hypothetical protein
VAGFPSGTQYTAEASLVYQSLHPAFMDDLLEYETDEVERFEGFWEEADKAPTVMKTIELRSSPTASSPDELPSVVELAKVFPNPFSRRINGFLRLSHAGNVNVSVYDVRGRHVRSIMDAWLIAGEHRFFWDGTDVSGFATPSGIYFLNVQSETETMVVTVARLAQD